MNVNRDSPYRIVDVQHLWWAYNGRYILIEFRFTPGLVNLRTGHRA